MSEIKKAFGLLMSMVSCRDNHTETSMGQIDKALIEHDSLIKEVEQLKKSNEQLSEALMIANSTLIARIEKLNKDKFFNQRTIDNLVQTIVELKTKIIELQEAFSNPKNLINTVTNGDFGSGFTKWDSKDE